MLVIRLRRGGRKHQPHYRIVVQEKRSKLNGKYLESLGHYHPALKDKTLVVDKERATSWLKQGAQVSETVTNLFVKTGILPDSAKISRVYSVKKKKTKEKPLPVKSPEPAQSSESVELSEPTESIKSPKSEELPKETAEQLEQSKEEPANPETPAAVKLDKTDQTKTDQEDKPKEG